jgi:hypothetical protein
MLEGIKTKNIYDRALQELKDEKESFILRITDYSL